MMEKKKLESKVLKSMTEMKTKENIQLHDVLLIKEQHEKRELHLDELGRGEKNYNDLQPDLEPHLDEPKIEELKSEHEKSEPHNDVTQSDSDELTLDNDEKKSNCNELQSDRDKEKPNFDVVKTDSNEPKLDHVEPNPDDALKPDLTETMEMEMRTANNPLLDDTSSYYVPSSGEITFIVIAVGVLCIISVIVY